MKYEKEFGRLLSLSVAIRRRDEVAVGQFLSQIGTEVCDFFDETEKQRGPQPRSGEAARRKRTRLNIALSEKISELKELVDEEGMDWLRTQLPQ